MSKLVSVRLRREVEVSAESYIEATGWTRTSLVNTALEEWLRLQAHPGIRFVANPNGNRIAALVGGPEVWTVAESWKQHTPPQRTVENVVAATGLNRREVECALDYYAAFTGEIDTQIKRVHQAQEQKRVAWERRQAING